MPAPPATDFGPIVAGPELAPAAVLSFAPAGLASGLAALFFASWSDEVEVTADVWPVEEWPVEEWPVEEVVVEEVVVEEVVVEELVVEELAGSAWDPPFLAGKFWAVWGAGFPPRPTSFKTSTPAAMAIAATKQITSSAAVAIGQNLDRDSARR